MRTRLFFASMALLVSLPLASSTIAADVKPDEIANKMTSVVDTLGRKQTGEPVQGEQKEIIRDLDALIAELEREAQNTRGGIKTKGPGMKESIISSGQGGMGALVNPDEGGKDWGKLSERERDRILQSMSEGFPPEYRTVLERYYRRLAEEKSAKTGGAATKANASAAPVKP